MRDALILAGLTIGMVMALFGGDNAQSVAPAARTSETTASSADAPAAAPAPARSAATELRRAGDGHFYAGVQVSGRPITMLIDTGASVVALTAEDAQAAGLQWNPADLRVVAQGASGPVRGFEMSLDRVTLGAHEARNVRAVIIPEGLPVSLLGQSFLATVDPVRIERDRMVLGGA